MTWTNAAAVRQFNVVLLGNLVAGGLTSPGVNKYEATLTAYMPGTFTIYLFVPASTFPSRATHHLLVPQRERLRLVVYRGTQRWREWSARKLTVGRHCEEQLNLWSWTQVAPGTSGTVQLN